MLDGFEAGKLSLEEYLTLTVFYRARPFTRDDFIGYMKDQSVSNPDVLELVGSIAVTRRYLLATPTTNRVSSTSMA